MAGIFDPGIFDSGIFDDAASGSAVNRTATDAPTTSDGVTRTLVGTRLVAAAPTTADVATRGTVLNRSATESIATSDVVNAATGALSRTATDAPTTSDAATRALTLSRAFTDAPTASTAATRTVVATRGVTDAPTTADTAVRSFALVRSVTEAFSSADVATRARNLGRITSESVSASIAATRSAVLSRALSQAAIAGDVALSVPQPYLPGPAIYIDGTNITKADGDPVLFATARFMSAVNGVAGEAHFRVRDDLGTTNYLPGQALQLIIDGQPAWTGFVTNVKRVYVFPALNVDDFGPTRFFDIDGTDLNILFSRRIVFDQAHPANILAPLYPTFTGDVTVISDLIAGWLDLSGDALDTSTDVHHVGAINEDQLARAWEGSDTWGQAMQSISALPASIYYIRPDRLFAYVDTDTPDAPFGLSDVPDGVTSKGYREMEVLFDGTNLANDVLAWGAGYGSNAPVFTRAQDATSESTHGRWQLGQTTFGVYKQATVNRIADSILNGSPEHHRGAKDDRRAVTITTYEPGLLPAQKVPFESAVFGYSEVLPIRKMEITFPTPTTPKYELTLSQEIDVPWSFFDPFRLKLPGLPGVPTITIPPLPTPGGCTDCGITDTFGRTVAETVHSTNAGTTDAPIGTSDAGVDYFNLINGHEAWLLSNGGIGLSVDGSALTARLFANAGSGLVFGSASGYLRTTVPMDHSATKSMTFRLSALPTAAGNGSTLTVAIPGGSPSGTKSARVFLNPGGIGVTPSYIGFTATTADGQVIPDIYWQSGTTYTLTLLDDGSGTTITVSDGTTAYSHTSTGYSGGTIENPALGLTSQTTGGAVTDQYTVTIDNLTIPEITRCSNFQYDTFERTVASGWADASSGPAWNVFLDGSATGSTSVAYGTGVMDLGATTNGNAATPDAGPWNTASGFVGTFRFKTDTVGGSIFVDISDADFNFEFTAKINNTSGFVEMASDGDSTVAKTDWAAHTWYVVRYEYRPSGVARAKVWELASAEPAGWSVSTTAYPATISHKLTFLAINGTGSAVEIDWAAIDFDYTGKPCYLSGDGTPFVIDDFGNRTIVVAAHTEGGTDGWGVASGGGTWTQFRSAANTMGVQSNEGVAEFDTFGGSGTVEFDMANDGGTNPQISQFDDQFLFSWRFKTNHVGAGTVSGSDDYQVIAMEVDRITDETSDSFLVRLVVSSGAGGPPTGGLIEMIGDTDTSATKTNWVADEWYTVQMNVTATQRRMKVWADIDVVPDWMLVEEILFPLTGTATEQDLTLIVTFNGDRGIIPTLPPFEIVNFDDFVVTPGSTPVLPSTGGPLFGPWQENATRIDATHYQLSRSILPNSAFVYLDGFIAITGTDFTEDDAAGRIVFTSSIDPAVTVTVSYTANGSHT